MKRYLCHCVLCGLLLVSAVCVYGTTITNGAGTTAFSFLKIGQGARAAAMGECYAGLSNDVNAIYWNPAGLAQIDRPELATNYTMWFEDIARYYIGYVRPGYKFGTLAGNLSLVSVPIEKRTVENDDSYESMAAHQMALTLAWAKKYSSKFSAGVGLKYISEDLVTQSVSGVAVDCGGLYTADDSLSVGASLQNLGTEMNVSGTSDPLPLMLQAGVAKKVLEKKLTLLSDINAGLIDETMSLSVGGEYMIGTVFYPRVGYKYRFNNNNLDGVGISAGFGLKLSRYRFDYAFVPYGDLGLTHRIDFIIGF